MACYVHQETPGPQRGDVSEALEETELMIKKISLFADGHSLSQDEKNHGHAGVLGTAEQK